MSDKYQPVYIDIDNKDPLKFAIYNETSTRKDNGKRINYVEVRNIEYRQGAITYDPDTYHYHPYVNYAIPGSITKKEISTLSLRNNTAQLKRAHKLLDKVNKYLLQIPSSGEYHNQQAFYENVIGEYWKWFEENNIKPPEKGIIHSKDYTEVTQWDTTYHFSPMQASAIRYMHERHKNGDAIIAQQDILENVKSESAYLKDIFKDNSAWKTLILRAKNTYYKLDIS